MLALGESEGTPFSVPEIGCGAIRRPLMSMSVLPAPMPRRSTRLTSPRAPWEAMIVSFTCGGAAKVSVPKRSAPVEPPRSVMSAWLNTVIGSAVSASTRRMFEPVTVTAASSTAFDGTAGGVCAHNCVPQSRAKATTAFFRHKASAILVSAECFIGTMFCSPPRISTCTDRRLTWLRHPCAGLLDNFGHGSVTIPTGSSRPTRCSSNPRHPPSPVRHGNHQKASALRDSVGK